MPAVTVGIATIPFRVVIPPNVPAVSAAIFGFGAGIFLYVGMDFHPECEADNEIDEIVNRSQTDYERRYDLRRHAAVSAVLGGQLWFSRGPCSPSKPWDTVELLSVAADKTYHDRNTKLKIHAHEIEPLVLQRGSSLLTVGHNALIRKTEYLQR